jgi:hypothetical protein
MEAHDISRTAAIAKFFRLAHEGLPEITAQVKELSEADKDELAPECAKALGMELRQEPAGT